MIIMIIIIIIIIRIIVIIIIIPMHLIFLTTKILIEYIILYCSNNQLTEFPNLPNKWKALLNRVSVDWHPEKVK